MLLRLPGCRCGFDFEIGIMWEAAVPTSTAAGALTRVIKGSSKLSNAASDDLDDATLSAELMCKQPDAAAAEAEALKRVKGLLPSFRRFLEQLLSELKER